MVVITLLLLLSEFPPLPVVRLIFSSVTAAAPFGGGGLVVEVPVSSPVDVVVVSVTPAPVFVVTMVTATVTHDATHT